MPMLDAPASMPVERLHVYDVSVRHLLKVANRELVAPFIPERMRVGGKEVPTIFEMACPTCGVIIRASV